MQLGTTPLSDYAYLNAIISADYKEPVKTVRIPFKFMSKMGHKYLSGGILTEKKIPVKYPMKSLKELLRDPGDVVVLASEAASESDFQPNTF